MVSLGASNSVVERAPPLKLVDFLGIEGGDLDLHFYQRRFDSPILSCVDFVTLGCLSTLDG